MKKLSIFLITLALIAGMVGCDDYTPSEDLEIRDWYDLDDVRNNLGGHHTLMNDLDSTTIGYDELASSTANGGKAGSLSGGEPGKPRQLAYERGEKSSKGVSTDKDMRYVTYISIAKGRSGFLVLFLKGE